MPELVDREQWQNQLRQALARVRLIHRIHALATVDSTNHFARKLAQKGAPAGTLVIARAQSAGRGRLGRVWESPANLGLWFSLLLKPPISGQKLGLLGFLPAVALVEVLQQRYGIAAATKWPNDVLIDRKKVAGILCESQVNGNQILFAVIGVGINVYQRAADFPATLQGQATSIQEATPMPVDSMDLLTRLFNNWSALLEALESGQSQNIIVRWKKHCAHMGKHIGIDCGNERLDGKFVDLSPEGAAIIENDRGERKLIFVGESTVFED